MARQPHYVDCAGNVRIACWIEGRKNAPWLILSNSLATTHTLWDFQVEQLKSRFQILRYDTRGHGASDVGDQAWTLEILAADVVAIMDAFGIEQAAFVGLSLGGMTGLQLALDYPDRLTSLVCCSARAQATTQYRAIWQQNLEMLGQDGLEALAAPTISRWFIEDWLSDPANQKIRNKVHAMFLSTKDDGYRQAARCLQQLSLEARLGEITIPVMYLAASEDAAAPPDVMAQMHTATPDSSFAVLDGTAHISNLGAPVAYTTQLQEWLAKHG